MATPCDAAARRTSSRCASAGSGVGVPAPRPAAPARARRRRTRTAEFAPRPRGRRPGRGSRAPCGSPTSSSPSCPCAGAPRRRARSPSTPRARGPPPGSGPPARRLDAASRPSAGARGSASIRCCITGHSSTGMKACTCAQYSTIRRGCRSDARREQLGVVGPHPGEQRHVVGPHQHVDRVDLEHPGAGQRARERAHRRDRVARVAEALRAERDPTGLAAAQRLHGVDPSGQARTVTLRAGRAASRGRRTSRPPSGSAAAASPGCCGRGS